MQQDDLISSHTRSLGEYTSPGFSLSGTPVTRASRQRLDWDDFIGLVEGPLQTSGSSIQATSSVCVFCMGQASTSAGECASCGMRLLDPQELFVSPLGMNASSTQTGPFLPAFGEMMFDAGALQGELDLRGPSPVDLSIRNPLDADDDDEAPQHGDTVAHTTDGGRGDDADGETDGTVFYNVDPTLVFPASVRLPEDGSGQYHDHNDEEDSSDQDDGDDDSDYQEDGNEEYKGEIKEEDTEEEQESATAAPNEGESATDDEEEGTNTPAHLSSFRHPDAPTHNWVAADIALQMIVRGTDENGRVTPAARTDAMMKLFPPAQRMRQLQNKRWKCRAMARIDLESMDWEEFACDGLTYKNRNDLRRHFTEKHLGDERPEKRCRANAKRKLDDEEDSQADLPATKRARRK